MKLNSLLIIILVLLSACATTPPKNTQNVCQIFREKDDWYQASLTASRRWGVPIAVQMSIIFQESSFIADAEPPRPTLLGFIPWFRSSSAFGYPQAQDGTWSDYQHQTGNRWADREDFADSCDFVAWYCAISNKKLGIPYTDAQHLYLAYHEGHTGYRRQHYKNKRWLMNVAQKVHQRAWQYDAQLATCRQELDSEN
ncbi:MAG: hypothetical protein M0R33_09215 [Methylomonas sp.]|jgi:hypothetical protein|uniref:transglycosylase SLT domain-containing protein n=1 Tax=Methylomonas sp. TaxID=418 RepID=UPI0025F9D191|nr:hypothetical protein [Methylomonas sp.]MCK9606614.1 hypothetical protein [Methylomonas sp.]